MLILVQGLIWQYSFNASPATRDTPSPRVGSHQQHHPETVQLHDSLHEVEVLGHPQRHMEFVRCSDARRTRRGVTVGRVAACRGRLHLMFCGIWGEVWWISFNEAACGNGVLTIVVLYQHSRLHLSQFAHRRKKSRSRSQNRQWTRSRSWITSRRLNDPGCHYL